MIPDLVVLCGEKHSGKGEVAKIFAQKIGKYSIVKQSQPAKRMCYDTLVWRGCSKENAKEYTYGHFKDTPTQFLEGLTPRMFQIGIMEGLRNMDPHFHPRICAARVDEHLRSGGQVVVDDCRDLNEFKMLAAVARQNNVKMMTIWIEDVSSVKDPKRVRDTRLSPSDCEHVIHNAKSSLQCLEEEVRKLILECF